MFHHPIAARDGEEGSGPAAGREVAAPGDTQPQPALPGAPPPRTIIIVPSSDPDKQTVGFNVNADSDSSSSKQQSDSTRDTSNSDSNQGVVDMDTETLPLSEVTSLGEGVSPDEVEVSVEESRAAAHHSAQGLQASPSAGDSQTAAATPSDKDSQAATASSEASPAVPTNSKFQFVFKFLRGVEFLQVGSADHW